MLPTDTLDSRRPIRLLDPHTVNQIAAGEVVERPASALKELVENALDAGATQVEVEVQGAGTRLIQVSDNGCGMDRESAETALLRHATSKITSVDDLMSVLTLGFRGEALPSIASVSRMTLSTGQKDGLRTQFVVDGGQKSEPKSISGPQGTTIRVEDLFYNTPARLKFLKSDATELALCVEVVSKAALARPDVRFILKSENSILLQTSGTGDLHTTLSEIWGRDTARVMIPVDLFGGSARVRGFVSPPHFTKPTRSQQWLFVNGRPMKSRSLTAALDQACRSLTPEKRYPLALLMIEIDPSRIDVNVSPTKSEVKFHQEGAVFDVVRRSVRDALLSTGMVPTIEELGRADAAIRDVYAPPPAPLQSMLFAQQPLGMPGSAVVEPYEPMISTALPDMMQGLKILGQVDRTFIIAENDHAMLIIDQHVAHERILYEMLVRTRGSGAIETQQLLEPELIHLERRAIEAVMPRLSELKEVGYEVEAFGTDSLIVRSVPALFRGPKPLTVLRDLLDQMADGVPSGCAMPARDEVFIMASCKMAIKAGDVISMAEMERLVQDLAQTDNPYLCPHGRPITIQMPKTELRRRFKR